MTAAARSSRRLQAAALLAPIIIAQGAMFLLGAGPAAAPASTGAAPVPLDPILAPAPAAPLSPQQQACLDYLASLHSRDEPLASPMAHVYSPAPAAPQPPSITPPEPAAAAPRQAPEVPALRLTAILDNRTGGMAAIDGRILRPGDEAAPGWRLLSIDAANNRIVIADDRGHTATIELSPRGAGF